MKLLTIFRLIKNIPKTSWSSKKPLNIKPKIKTLLFLIFGLFLFGLGETLLLASGAGVSPWTVLAEGISIYSSYSVGWSTFWMSLAVLLLWIPLKQKPGIGTILNVIIIALVFDYTLPYLPNPENYGFKVLQVIIGVLITGLGSGFLFNFQSGSGTKRWVNDWGSKDNRKTNSISKVHNRSNRSFFWMEVRWYGGIGYNYICFRYWSNCCCWHLFCK